MVTILLATYNGEDYIRQQLDSLLNQTHKRLSILISDDQSTDRTPEIINEYKKKYPEQIQSLIHIKPSGSPQNNFFRLLSAADDDYIMLCDQDDIWLSDKVEVTLNEMRRLESQWGKDLPLLVHGDLSVTDEEGTIRQLSMAKFQKIAVYDNRFTHYLVENNITGNTIMINRSFLPFFSYLPKQCMMHDWWLGLLASCFGKISYVDRPLLLYRQHGGNQVGSKGGLEQYVTRLTKKERSKEQYRKMFLQARSFLNQYGEEMDKEKKEALEQFVQLPKRSRLNKVRIILKYKFYKSTVIRTFGQMLSI